MAFTISPTELRMELTNRCSCVTCPTCMVDTRDLAHCEVCGSGMIPLFRCSGCLDDAVEQFDSELLWPWVQENPSANGYYVADSLTGSRGVSVLTLFNPDLIISLPELLAPSLSQWRQRWSCEPWHRGQLGCRQSSDDDTRQAIEVRPATDQEVEDL